MTFWFSINLAQRGNIEIRPFVLGWICRQDGWYQELNGFGVGPRGRKRQERVRESLAPTKARCFCWHKMRQDQPVVITLRRVKQVGEKMFLSFVWLNCMLLWAVWLEGLKLLLITLPFRKNLVWSFPAGPPSRQQGLFPDPRPPPLPFASFNAPLSFAEESAAYTRTQCAKLTPLASSFRIVYATAETAWSAPTPEPVSAVYAKQSRGRLCSSLGGAWRPARRRPPGSGPAPAARVGRTPPSPAAAFGRFSTPVSRAVCPPLAPRLSSPSPPSFFCFCLRLHPLRGRPAEPGAGAARGAGRRSGSPRPSPAGPGRAQPPAPAAGRRAIPSLDGSRILRLAQPAAALGSVLSRLPGGTAADQPGASPECRSSRRASRTAAAGGASGSDAAAADATASLCPRCASMLKKIK